MWELADVRLDKVFFFVDELGCPFRHQTPGKHGFFGARWVRAFPHEQPVLLRLIPQALPICNDFGVPVLVSRFQIIGPFLRILVDGEEKLDLLFLILEVIVLIGDNGHDLLFIQKAGSSGLSASSAFRVLGCSGSEISCKSALSV